MDPIDPIIRVAPGPSPVNPAPRVTPARDDPARSGPDGRERRRRRENGRRDQAAGYWDPSGGDADLAPEWDAGAAGGDGEDDGHPHIDVIA